MWEQSIPFTNFEVSLPQSAWMTRITLATSLSQTFPRKKMYASYGNPLMHEYLPQSNAWHSTPNLMIPSSAFSLMSQHYPAMLALA
jgi:hypothetical protein